MLSRESRAFYHPVRLKPPITLPFSRPKDGEDESTCTSRVHGRCEGRLCVQWEDLETHMSQETLRLLLCKPIQTRSSKAVHTKPLAAEVGAPSPFMMIMTLMTLFPVPS